jgi:hypothetical protein
MRSNGAESVHEPLVLEISPLNHINWSVGVQTPDALSQAGAEPKKGCRAWQFAPGLTNRQADDPQIFRKITTCIRFCEGYDRHFVAEDGQFRS